jgi:hypothetical protein
MVLQRVPQRPLPTITQGQHRIHLAFIERAHTVDA